MAWIEQTAPHTWRVRYRDKERRIQSSSGFASEQQAADFLAHQDERRRFGSRVDPADGRIMLDDWVTRSLPTLSASERTEENYRRELRNHVLPQWGDRRLASITGAEVHAWEGQLQADGYAPSTVATMVKLFSRVMGDAVDARLICENPAPRRPHRGPRVLRPVVERVWATPEQVVQVAEHATSLGAPLWGR